GGAVPGGRGSQEHRHDGGRGGDQAQAADHPRDIGGPVGRQGAAVAVTDRHLPAGNEQAGDAADQDAPLAPAEDGVRIASQARRGRRRGVGDAASGEDMPGAGRAQVPGGSGGVHRQGVKKDRLHQNLPWTRVAGAGHGACSRVSARISASAWRARRGRSTWDGLSVTRKAGTNGMRTTAPTWPSRTRNRYLASAGSGSPSLTTTSTQAPAPATALAAVTARPAAATVLRAASTTGRPPGRSPPAAGPLITP